MSNGYHIDSLRAKITDRELLVTEARKEWYEALPPLPLVPTCPVCGANWTDFCLQRMEFGYVRWTNGYLLDYDDIKSFKWCADGWDDMSEHGDFEYVECCSVRGGCGACFQLPDPDKEDWD